MKEKIMNVENNHGYYWQVQRLDNPEDDEALLGKLQNDFKLLENIVVK